MTEDSSRPEDSRSRTWTVLELLRWTTDHFRQHGIESPRLDAEVLLTYALGIKRLELYLEFERPVMPEERARYREMIRRRVSERAPVSILVGEKEFWSHSFRVSSEVLTPRPDTETLVEGALVRMPDLDRGYSVLDLGTGSGAIAVSLAVERPEARVTATDLSPAALSVARQNAQNLEMEARIEFLEGDLFGPVSERCFDLVVSNPPYLARQDQLDLPPELGHEPEVALFGGEDGYSVLKPLSEQVFHRIKPGGWFLVEMDPGQVKTVSGWLLEQGMDSVEPLKDLAGRERVVACRRPQ